ncbi:MAG: TrkH family potassium uptake protein [Bacteroidales bacterium]|nr:TrkH family potassium uptake protein [Bacteroidales bacterium]
MHSRIHTFQLFNPWLWRVVGALMLYLAGALLVAVGVSLYYGDGMQFALLFSAAVVLMAGLFLRNMVGWRRRKAAGVGGEGLFDFQLSLSGIEGVESYWLTVCVWTVLPVVGALPYLFTGVSTSVTDAVFESVSGFTTTGSTTFARPECLPVSMLVYRAMTQWVGGLGLLLLAVALLRRVGMGAGSLYEAEFSGTQQRRLHPRLARSVRRMWMAYGLMTVLMAVVLWVQGVGVVDAVCTACSTVSTGGFMTHGVGSELAAGSSGVMATLTLFMLLSGMNVAVLYRVLTLRWRGLWREGELRMYVLLYVLAVAVCTAALVVAGNGWEESVRYGVFHIAATMSTCGFYTPAPQRWPVVVGVLTFALLVTGAMSGSTGGGMKLRRVMIIMKYIANYFTRMLHPNVVFRVKVNGQVVENDYINKVFAFVFLYIVFIVAGGFVLTLCGCSIPDAVCLAAANVSNLGPSPLINELGGSLDYALLPDVAKWVLALLMIAGRVELFALVAVLSPSYYRKLRIKN